MTPVKTAFLDQLQGTIIPDGNQIAHAVQKVAPPMLITGVGLAGLKHLASSLSMLRSERERKKQNDILEVRIPAQPKVASLDTILMKLAPNLRSTLGNRSVRGMQVGIKDIAGAVGKDLARPVQPAIDLVKSRPMEAAGAAGATGAAGLAAAGLNHLPDPNSQISANPVWDSGLYAGAGLGALGLGYLTANALMSNRRKKQLQGELDAAKNEYAGLLGRTLSTAGKTASVGEEAFPVVQGFCAKLAEDALAEEGVKLAEGPNWISSLTSAPSAVGVVAGLLAHKFIYDRMKEVEKLHTVSKPKPPKQIRIVTDPIPAEPLEEKEQLSLPAPKVARLSPTAAGVTAAITGPIGSVIHGAVASTNNYNERKQKEKRADLASDLLGATKSVMESPTARLHTSPERVERTSREPIAKAVPVMVDENTAQIATPQGNVTVDAADPQAASQLPQTTKRLSKVLASLQAQQVEE